MNIYSRFAVILFCLLLCPGGCADRQPLDAAVADGALPNMTSDKATIASLDSDDEMLDDTYSRQLIPDPLEPWNRGVFYFNDGIVTYVGKPLSAAYRTIMPDLLRESVTNFFDNLLFPVRFVNNLLQGKGLEAYKEFARFFINTTAGFGGLFNVAATEPELAIRNDREDFGQTLGTWGVGEGLYLYWPLLGPSNIRDSIGKIGDWALDPITYIRPNELSWTLTGVRGFSDLDAIMDQYEELTKSAIEPYTAVRDAYVQYRRAKIAK